MDDMDYQGYLRKQEKNDNFRRWLDDRLRKLLEQVTAHDVLRHFGVDVKGDHEVQISCPFHGVDRKPSARVYPTQGTSRSGVYCYTCMKRWDIVGLWKNFHGDTEMKYTAALRGLEQAFSVTPPDAPVFGYNDEGVAVDAEKQQEVKTLLEVCERRLKEGRASFTRQGYLTVGRLLDALHYDFGGGHLAPHEIESRARMILDKIGEKVRAAPAQDQNP